jgi:hypothetical protein
MASTVVTFNTGEIKTDNTYNRNPEIVSEENLDGAVVKACGLNFI